MISYFRSVLAGLARVSRRRAPIASLSFVRPYFFVEYRTESIGWGMKNIFLSNEDLLLDFVKQGSLQGYIVVRVRVMSPGYMHDSKFWHFEDLIALWEAEEPNMYEPALLYTLSTGVELVKSASFTPIEHLGKRKLIYRAP